MDHKADHDDEPHWLDEPRNVKRLWRGFLVVLALTVLAELLVHLHPHFADRVGVRLSAPGSASAPAPR